jgi:hypothetical protein
MFSYVELKMGPDDSFSRDSSLSTTAASPSAAVSSRDRFWSTSEQELKFVNSYVRFVLTSTEKPENQLRMLETIASRAFLLAGLPASECILHCAISLGADTRILSWLMRVTGLKRSTYAEAREATLLHLACSYSVYKQAVWLLHGDPRAAYHEDEDGLTPLQVLVSQTNWRLCGASGPLAECLDEFFGVLGHDLAVQQALGSVCSLCGLVELVIRGADVNLLPRKTFRRMVEYFCVVGCEPFLRLMIHMGWRWYMRDNVDQFKGRLAVRASDAANRACADHTIDKLHHVQFVKDKLRSIGCMDEKAIGVVAEFCSWEVVYSDAKLRTLAREIDFSCS